MLHGAALDASMEHLRQYERAPFAGVVRFFEWDRARTAPAAEISGGGLFLQTPLPLPEGRLLTLRLELPGMEQAFTVLARVVRTVRGGLPSQVGMGLQFLDIGPGHRARIEGYVAARAR